MFWEVGFVVMKFGHASFANFVNLLFNLSKMGKSGRVHGFWGHTGQSRRVRRRHGYTCLAIERHTELATPRESPMSCSVL